MELDVGIVFAVLCGFLLLRHAWSVSSSKVDNVPVLGNPAFSGYFTAFKSISSFRHMMVDGHNRFKGRPFQLPAIRGWIVYLSQELYEDVRKARDDTFSFQEDVNETIAIEHTVGKTVSMNMWHNTVVRKQMTSNLGALFSDIYDEIVHAFEDELRLPDNGEWNSVCAYDVFVHVICRTSNRMLVGLPLCRNKEYIQSSSDFITSVIKAGFFISCFPKFLKPLVAPYLSPAPATIKVFEKHIIPMIDERRRQEVELGEDVWAKEKPFDFLQWMMDAAVGEQQDAKDLTNRLLAMNFASSDTSSMGFTHAFYWLVTSSPSVSSALRDEVESALREHGGWTKAALESMIKVDSFLKETMRYTGILASSLARIAMRPVVLSDGTQVPAGTRVAVNIWSVHRDPAIYERPEEFDPWRFSRKVEAGEGKFRHAFTTPSSEFLAWGGGIHVCAGRFFASNMLKAMLAHIVLTYDFALPTTTVDEGMRPSNMWFLQRCRPDKKAIMMFRRKERGVAGAAN